MIKRIALLLFIGLAFAQEITIAVLDFDGDGVSQSETRTLTNRLRDEMFNTGIYIVLERGKMDEVLKEQGFQQTGCVTSECAVEVGNMLGVQQMIGGSIGKVGNIYTVSARMIDVETGKVLKSANYDHIGDIGQLLIKGMKNVVNQLITGRKVKSGVIQTKGKGTLYIKSTPSSADVWVDGYKVEGKTPLTIPDLDEGSHTLQIVKQQFELTKTASVKANEITKVDAVLQLSKENLNVFSTPDGASVSIDGRSQRGLTPITVKNLSVGQHTVIITKDGYERHEAQINIEKDTTNRYSVNLEKITGLTVIGNIRDATIQIINKNIKEFEEITDERFSYVNRMIVLPKGDYVLKVIKKGYETYLQHFSLKSCEKKTINVELILITGTIKVSTEYPPETEVFLYTSNHIIIESGLANNRSIWKVKPGSYIIKIICPGYFTLKKDIQIIGNDIIRISDPLESNEWILKEIRSLKMKRNRSFIFAGLIAGTGGLLRSLDLADSLAPVFFSVGGVTFSLPFYYHSKIGTLTKMLAE
jgi:TolB-like protein